MAEIKQILIVGGGTAGWLTAAFLARTLGADRADSVSVTVLESSDIDTIGVGEGTFPSIRSTLALIGIPETEFVRECSATFKQGIRFADWVRPPGDAGAPHYFHPFNAPSQRNPGLELLPYWLSGDAGPGTGFAGAVSLQTRVVDAGRGPKRLGDGDYQGALNYAYHLDAGRFAALLRKRACSLGVRHCIGTVAQVEQADDGMLAAVQTRDGTRHTADLFIDCTGFHAELIGKILKSPFHAVDDVLFADRALALQVPYPRDDAPIASFTISAARSAGWIWDIGLQERRGVGYVYSSRHLDDAAAQAELRNYVGPAADALSPRSLRFQSGYRERSWIGNCVAIGLSGGFLEPLEASGIGLIETAVYLLAALLPQERRFDAAARHFNALMRERYTRIVAFLKLHYCISQRRDSAFWRDNSDPAGVPDSLRDLLEAWRHRAPHRLDFVADFEMYPTSSWQYVLYGMEYPTVLTHPAARYPRSADARREFAAIREVGTRAAAELPGHRALVQHLCGRRGGPTVSVRHARVAR